MDTNELTLVTNEYDDGVVCFGPVTESQLNRYNRLPRRTVLPSDFELSQSLFEPGEDKKNDQSTLLDIPNESTTTCVDNSINITQSANNLEEEKEKIGIVELKQSISEDSNSRFSSPRFSKCLPNAKLIDTEVINRYIRMGSISSNESSLSEDQNKSTFEDESVSFTDAQEAELIQDNYVYDETSSCEHLSVSSVIERSASINQQNILDDSNNVCALIHCSQKDDTDLSICSDLELANVSEDSIVADEYSVTPGKQRLFDLRVTKQSLRAKALVASAPFMDRIEETTTPVLPKVCNSPLIVNDISYRHSKTKESLNASLTTEICHETSTEHFNQTSNENMFEISKFTDETTGGLLKSNNLEDVVSVDTILDETTNSNKHSTISRSINIHKSLIKTDEIETLNDTTHNIDDEISEELSSAAIKVDIPSTNSCIVVEEFDETMHNNKLSTNNQSMDSNKSLNETYHIESNLDGTELKFDTEKSTYNISISVTNDNNDEEYSVPMEVDIKSVNTSIVNEEFDETMYTNELATYKQDKNLDESLNETNLIKSTFYDTKQKFDGEKSTYDMSNVTIPTSGINDYNEEYSVPMEIDIKSKNTSEVNIIVDETMYINKLSTNNQSMDLNKSVNEANHIENTLNDTEQKYENKNSTFIMSDIAIQTSCINVCNDVENSIATKVDIKSINTSVVDEEFDETMYTDELPTYKQDKNLDESLNDTNLIKSTLYDTKQKFDGEKSTYDMSNVTIPTSGINDYNEEYSVPIEIDIKSKNTSEVNIIVDETMYINKLSTNNQSMDLNKSVNETNHIENTLNDTEQQFGDEKSSYKLSNIAIPTSGINYNDKENSIATEVDIKSINTSVVDEKFDETMYINKLSTNNQSMDMNKSLNETNHIKNTFNDTDQKCYGEENSIATAVDIKSINTSVVDEEFDETMYINKISTNNQSMDLNKSLNETNHIKNTFNDTEQKCYDEENSIATEVDIKSINTSVVNEEFDETMYTDKLPTKKQNLNLDKSLNETNHVENTLNCTESKFDEKSMNILSNVAILTSHVNDEKYLVPMEVDFKSTNTSFMDKDFNKSLNDTEQKYENEKSTFIMSDIAIQTACVNVCNDEENSIATKVDIKSIDTSVVDKVFDESIYANKLSTNNSSIILNEIEKTSNNTDDKLNFSKLDKSILKNTTNSGNSFVENSEINITCNTSLEDPSYKMRQYLDFELAVNEMCNDISSARNPDGKCAKPKECYDDETLEHLIEQTLSSDTFHLTNVNENFSNYDGSNLSVIIENKSLETSTSNVDQNEDFENLNYDVPIPLESECIVKKIRDKQLLNKLTVENTVSTFSKSEVGIPNGTDVNIQIETKSNECTITDSGLVENVNESKHIGSPMSIDKFSKIEHDISTKTNKNSNNISTKQIFVPEDVNEINSIQNTLDPIANEIKTTDVHNLIDRDELLNDDNQQQDLLDTTKSIDNSLEEFTNLEQMFNFGDNKKEKQVEYKTPKTQKLLDFSIVQQTPTYDNQAKKQKLLNFSIVDQTPILKSTQQTHPNENVINNDSLINFSSVDQMWNSEVVPKDEINFKDFQISSNECSSNNLSTVSLPDLELLADESIKTNTSNCSNSSFNQTITNLNLNLSTSFCTANKTQNHTTELNNVEPLVLINKQIVPDELSNSLNQTIAQNETKQKTFCDEHSMAEASTNEVKTELKLLSNTTFNENIDSAEFKEDSNQELHLNSNKRAIVDFSIIDQGISVNVELKNNTDITYVESDRNVSNLFEMSLVPIPVIKSDEQSISSSKNPTIALISDNRSEKSIDSRSDKMNGTTLHFEDSAFLLNNNTELLTDIQMNDESLLTESPEKSSMIDSFHSIEFDHVQEDNKRKMETTQEYDNNEKKMKLESEILKTPMSMLYKIKNMFRSSEKQPSCVNNTKENNLKSSKCYQKLNFNKFEENSDDFTKPIPLKKPEVLTKSKIPCKVTDRSLTKNDEFHNSSLLSLNESLKQKKTIPKFSGVPVLSDVSNSSNRKCAESRIPSKFQK